MGEKPHILDELFIHPRCGSTPWWIIWERCGGDRKVLLDKLYDWLTFGDVYKENLSAVALHEHLRSDLGIPTVSHSAFRWLLGRAREVLDANSK